MEQFPKMDFGGSRNGTVRLLWLLRARLLCIGGSGWPQWCENDSPTSEKTQSQLLYKLLLAVSRELWNWFHNDSIPEFSATNPTKNCHEVLALQPAFTRGCRLYRGDASAMMLGLSLEVWSIWGVRIASVLYHDVFHLPHILGCSLFSMPHHGMSLRDFTKAWVIPLQASGISLEISWGWVKTY